MHLAVISGSLQTLEAVLQIESQRYALHGLMSLQKSSFWALSALNHANSVRRVEIKGDRDAISSCDRTILSSALSTRFFFDQNGKRPLDLAPTPGFKSELKRSFSKGSICSKYFFPYEESIHLILPFSRESYQFFEKISFNTKLILGHNARTECGDWCY